MAFAHVGMNYIVSLWEQPISINLPPHFIKLVTSNLYVLYKSLRRINVVVEDVQLDCMTD